MHVLPSEPTGIPADVTDRARVAVSVFRKMQHGLTAYARAITGDPKIRVEVSAGVARTDGKIIYYSPPIALGDKTPHDINKCHQRNEYGLKSCPACRLREEVLVNIYHEIAHIAFGSFEGDVNYMVESLKVNEFMPFLYNCLEDSRVDASMFEARKGTRKMLEADVFELLRNGVPDAAGNVWHTQDSPLNSQVSLGLYFEIADYKGWSEFMHDKIGEDIADPEVQYFVHKIRKSTSAKSVFEIAEPLMSRLREMGYFQSEEEQKEQESEDDDVSPSQEASPAGVPEPSEDGSPDPGDESGGSPPPEQVPSERSEEGGESGPEQSDGGQDGGDLEGEGEASPEREAGDAESSPDGMAGDGDGGGSDDDDRGQEDSPGGSDQRPEVDASRRDAGEHGTQEGSPEQGSGGSEGGPEQPGPGDSHSPLSSEDGPGPGGADSSGKEAGEPGPEEGTDPQRQPDQEGPGGHPGEGKDDLPGDAEHQGVRDPSRQAPDPSDEVAPQEEAGADGPDGQGSDQGPVGEESDQPDEVGEGDSEAGRQPGSPGEGSSGGDPDAQGEGDSQADGSQVDGSDTDGVPQEDVRTGGADGGREPSPLEPDEQTDSTELDGERRGDPEEGSSLGEGVAGSDETDPGEQADPQLDDGSREGGSGGGPEQVPNHDQPEPTAEPQAGDPGLGNASELRPQPEVDRPDEVLESGADQGLGGLEVNESPLPKQGSPEDVEAAMQVAHTEVDREDPTELEMLAVALAIIQGIYFESPSYGVTDVQEYRHDPTTPAWNASRFTTDSDKLHFGISCDMDVPEMILGPALLKTRRIFSDNKVSTYQPNMRSGRVNAKVLGKRAWRGDDDRLFGKKRIPGKKDYAVLIMMDISSSNLGDNLVLLKRSVFAQAELLSRLGVSFAIVAHSCGFIHVGEYHSYSMQIHHVKEWDEPWNNDVKNRVGDLVGVGGNLDGHAMEFGRKLLEKVVATDKILLYYTDGKMPAANHDEELEVLQRQIKLCKRDNVTLLGVGIRTDSPVRHGLDTVAVNADSDLQAVIDHLGKRLAVTVR